MTPVAKVLLVVLIVLVVVYLLKNLGGDRYTAFLDQTFETVPAKPFVVSNVPLVVSAPRVTVSGAPAGMDVEEDEDGDYGYGDADYGYEDYQE
jgi:hypothetical protein